MRAFIFSFFLVLLPHILFSQNAVEAFGSKILFAEPDSTKWKLVENSFDDKRQIGAVIFECNPITDAEGRSIRPVLAIIYERLQDTTSVIQYSVQKRMTMGFKVNKVLGFFTKDLSYVNSVGYEGEYGDDILHKVLIGHLVHKLIGVQVICDATEGVFEQVESDMRRFLKSVNFKN